MRLYLLLLALLLAGLQYRLWWGADTWPRQHELEASLTAQRDENARLVRRNALLAAEVTALRGGLTAVEARARTELGMIGEGEVLYQIVE